MGERMARRVSRSEPEVAEVARGFDSLLVQFRHAGGQEIDMASLDDLALVARVRGLPLLRHQSEDGGGWVAYLVLDGAGRLAFRFTERENHVEVGRATASPRLNTSKR